MPARPAARQRLADLMERRRLDLGLTWREVAEAGNISYEVIRAIRNGNGQIRPLSKRGIEVGLKWAAGSVQAILDDNDPMPIPDKPAAVAPAAPVIADPEPIPVVADDAEAVASAGIIALLPPLERRVWEEIHRHPEGTPAEVIFSDEFERALWRRVLAPERQRIREIAAWRSVQVRPTRPARRAG